MVVPGLSPKMPEDISFSEEFVVPRGNTEMQRQEWLNQYIMKKWWERASYRNVLHYLLYHLLEEYVPKQNCIAFVFKIL